MLFELEYCTSLCVARRAFCLLSDRVLLPHLRLYFQAFARLSALSLRIPTGNTLHFEDPFGIVRKLDKGSFQHFEVCVSI